MDISDKKKLKVWSIAGVLVVFLLAGGWHFLYSHVLKSGVTAVIAPVNESPWEHAKLFFVPAIIWYVILYFIPGRNFPNFVFSHAIALLVMPVLMLLLFYAYQIFIPEKLIIDIILSFIVLAAGQFLAYKLTTSDLKLSGPGYCIASMVIVLALFIAFIVFTFNPPHWDIFLDTENMKYGI